MSLRAALQPNNRKNVACVVEVVKNINTTMCDSVDEHKLCYLYLDNRVVQ